MSVPDFTLFEGCLPDCKAKGHDSLKVRVISLEIPSYNYRGEIAKFIDDEKYRVWSHWASNLAAGIYIDLTSDLADTIAQVIKVVVKHVNP